MTDTFVAYTNRDYKRFVSWRLSILGLLTITDYYLQKTSSTIG